MNQAKNILLVLLFVFVLELKVVLVLELILESIEVVEVVVVVTVVLMSNNWFVCAAEDENWSEILGELLRLPVELDDIELDADKFEVELVDVLPPVVV